MKFIKTNLSNRVFTITLSRSEVMNALNPEMIKEITKAFQSASKDKKVRVIVVDAEGAIFCAGADLNWMKNSIKQTKKENLSSANALYDMYYAIYSNPKPVIAKIQGSAYGGGVGLIACCDIAIMSANSTLSLSELKLGLIPSTIAPFFQRKIGLHNLKYYGLISKKIPADECKRIGLVHDTVASQDELDAKASEYVETFMTLSPQAITRFKKLCDDIEYLSAKKAKKITSEEIADIRTTKDAQEGLTAFFEKRKPNWP
ncbi:MAG: enoyl-CoA hydratase-related protein [Bdellovibrionota bacterium]